MVFHPRRQRQLLNVKKMCIIPHLYYIKSKKNKPKSLYFINKNCFIVIEMRKARGVRVIFSEEEQKMVEKLKNEIGVKATADLIRILIRKVYRDYFKD